MKKNKFKSKVLEISAFLQTNYTTVDIIILYYCGYNSTISLVTKKRFETFRFFESRIVFAETIQFQGISFPAYMQFSRHFNLLLEQGHK